MASNGARPICNFSLESVLSRHPLPPAVGQVSNAAVVSHFDELSTCGIAEPEAHGARFEEAEPTERKNMLHLCFSLLLSDAHLVLLVPVAHFHCRKLF